LRRASTETQPTACLETDRHRRRKLPPDNHANKLAVFVSKSFSNRREGMVSVVNLLSEENGPGPALAQSVKHPFPTKGGPASGTCLCACPDISWKASKRKQRKGNAPSAFTGPGGSSVCVRFIGVGSAWEVCFPSLVGAGLWASSFFAGKIPPASEQVQLQYLWWGPW